MGALSRRFAVRANGDNPLRHPTARPANLLTSFAASVARPETAAWGTALPQPALARQQTVKRRHPMKGALAWLIGIPIPIIIILYLLDVF